jgi:hypothetical protein
MLNLIGLRWDLSPRTDLRRLPRAVGGEFALKLKRAGFPMDHREAVALPEGRPCRLRSPTTNVKDQS